MEALLAALAPGGWGWAAVAAVGGLVVFLILATRAGVGRGHKDRTNAPPGEDYLTGTKCFKSWGICVANMNIDVVKIFEKYPKCLNHLIVGQIYD
jgi:hypothetical protein